MTRLDKIQYFKKCFSSVLLIKKITLPLCYEYAHFPLLMVLGVKNSPETSNVWRQANNSKDFSPTQ